MASLADSIIKGRVAKVSDLLRYDNVVNELDEYGFRPLIEASIVSNLEIAELLLSHHADPNLLDMNGSTALFWAVENSNLELVRLLLENGADPNIANFSGQAPLVMAILRDNKPLQKALIEKGADRLFAQDFIYTKLAGHCFELVGTASIVSPKNTLIEVNFEGYYLEVTLGLVATTLQDFLNHFSSRRLRPYHGIAERIYYSLKNAAALSRYNQYLIDVSKYQNEIRELFRTNPLIIPVGYEGHAITFITAGPYWIKCDRREDSRLYDHVTVYRIKHGDRLTPELIQFLIYEKQTYEFINVELDAILGLTPFTEIQVEAQISGNCSWANVEATIPAVFFLILLLSQPGDSFVSQHKKIALHFFHEWRRWNKERVLNFCIQRYQESDFLRKTTCVELMAAILLQRFNTDHMLYHKEIETILHIVLGSPYEYILRNYLKTYYYNNYTEEGKRFFDLLQSFGFKSA